MRTHATLTKFAMDSRGMLGERERGKEGGKEKQKRHMQSDKEREIPAAEELS